MRRFRSQRPTTGLHQPDDAAAFAVHILESGTRRTILTLLRSAERTPGEIAAELGCKKPGLSYHLSVLAAAGLIRVRSLGHHLYYRLDEDRVLMCWALLLLSATTGT